MTDGRRCKGTFNPTPCFTYASHLPLLHLLKNLVTSETSLSCLDTTWPTYFGDTKMLLEESKSPEELPEPKSYLRSLGETDVLMRERWGKHQDRGKGSGYHLRQRVVILRPARGPKQVELPST